MAMIPAGVLMTAADTSRSESGSGAASAEGTTAAADSTGADSADVSSADNNSTGSGTTADGDSTAADVTTGDGSGDSTAADVNGDQNGTDADTYSGVTAIYLNGQSGDDAKDGTSAANAVKTFEKAKQIATAHSGITTIYITGTVPISKDITLKGTNSKVMRDTSFTGYLMEVSGTASLKDITIDGNGTNVYAQQSLINITETGSLTIEEGADLKNNNAATSATVSNAFGGALYIKGGTVEMTAGTIEGNTAMWGGGVHVSDGGKFTLSGGTIKNNKALAGSEVAAGGGISIGTYRAGNESAKGLNKLIMTGGSISSNKSNGCGGGIYIADGTDADYGYAEISAGNITNNTMLGGSKTTNYDFGGGGIYVNGSSKAGIHNGELHLTNVLITSNAASAKRTTPRYRHSGGGIASCPSSQTILNINDGAAIYGNKSGYAHDIYIYSATDIGDHSGNPAYQISPFMLGGTAYNWMLESGDYASLSDLNGVNKSNHYELRLHTSVTNDEAAKSLAKVIISGNTSSTSGGGIGSNGTVVIGTGSGTKTLDLSIQKKWSVQSNLNIGDKITVAVYCKHAGTDEKPVLVGNQYIKKTGKWAASITNLPAEDEDGKEYEYSIGEVKIPGFTQDKETGIFTADDGSGAMLVSEVKGDQESGFTVTNKQITSISVQKNWNDSNDQDGKRPESLMVHLIANGEQTGEPVKLTADKGWKYTWDNLDAVDDNGNLIKYSVTEDNPNDYSQSSSTVTTSGTSLTRETRSTENTINVHVTKDWPEGSTHPSSIGIALLADGKPVDGKTAILKADSWSADFKDLPAKNAEGSEIVYTVKETSAGGYTAENISFKTADVTVKGSWGSSETKPDSVTVQLLANGTAVEGKTAVLNEDNDWTTVISGLDKHDSSGNAISYTVEKVTDSGTEYDYHITASTSSTAMVGDYLVIKQVNQWNSANVGYIISRSDSAPAGSGSIDFLIIDSSGNVNSTMTLNEANEWSYTSGMSIPDGWSLRVSAVDGYQIGGPTTTSDRTVALTNKHVPETITISGTKVWEDKGNIDGRPNSITIHLWKQVGDGELEEVIDKKTTVTSASADQNDSNKWNFKFTDLPKYENGKEITYTITEDQVPGYNSPVITGNATDGFTIINKSGEVLPDVGGPGLAGCIGGGILLITAAALLYLMSRKKSHI